MACINPNSPEFKEILSKVNNPLLAEIEMDKSISVNDTNPTDSNTSTLENKLIDGFLKDFNITATEYESLKTELGIDAYSMSDLITKSIAYEQGESILPEVAYFAYSMLGKQNSKLRSELKYLVNKWDKYKERFEYHKNIILQEEGFIDNKKQWQSKVRDLVILDFLNESINLHYTNPQQFTKQLDSKWTYEDFTLWNKIVTWIEDLLSSYSKKYKNRKEKLVNIGISIADEILNQNYEYFDYNIKEGQLQKYYTETINKDAFAKEFTTYCREQLNFILTGSLALRKAGSVYRTVDENIHDIDYVIPYELTNTSKNKKYLDSIRNHTGEDVNFSSLVTMENVQKFDWYKKFIAKYPTYKIINGFYGEEHGNFQSYTLTGVIDGEYYTSNGRHEEEVSFYRKDPVTKKPIKIKKTVNVNHKKGDLIKDTGYVVDFFIRLTPNQEEHTNYFKLWKEIMIAKLKMGRDKDFIDWKMFVPFLKSKDKFNFNYEGFRHINYKNSQVNAFKDTIDTNISINNPTIQEAISWIKSVMPDANIDLVNELIDDIGKGSYDTVKDLIALSEKYANKKTAKHEVFHKAFSNLSKEKQEELLDEGSKLFGIPRGESKVTVKYSKTEQNQIDYMLKSVDLLQTEKGIQLFKSLEKNKVTGDNFWKKVQDLGIPKNQIILLKQYNTLNREELITNMLADYSFIIESNVSKELYKEESTSLATSISFELDGYVYQKLGDLYGKAETGTDNFIPIDNIEFINKIVENNKRGLKNTSYYANLTVPGGTNYTENEIATPLITPSIKGHAQFATDKGIGWFRSDDKTDDTFTGEEYDNEDFGIDPVTGESITKPIKTKVTSNKKITKTRRILEVQSDLFQKWRNNFEFQGNKYTAKKDDKNVWHYYKNSSEINANEYTKTWETFLDTYLDNANAFTKLLQKDNNWVTLFVKAIIQDSAKKGYEKVLLPSGNTASKIEGHTTLEEFKKQKESRIKELELQKSTAGIKFDSRTNKYALGYRDNTGSKVKEFSENKLELEQQLPILISSFDNEITQLKQELERVEIEGFGALKPIYNFYENTVTNILKKQGFNPVLITDEYGNTWNEITITPKYLDTIKFKSNKLEYTGDLAIEEKMAEMMENTPDENLPKSILGKWIQSVRNFFRNLFKERDILQRFMRDINQGRYANQKSIGIDSGKRYSQLSKQNYKTNDETIAKIESNRNRDIQELIRSNSSVYNRYAILADNDYIKAKLRGLTYTEKVKKLVEMGVLASFDQTGTNTNNPNDISLGWTTNRPIVMVRFGDEVVPFYRSSKGNSGKESGRWYNFFGFGEDGWLIKADIATIKRYYDNPFWKKIGDLLTEVLDYDHELDKKKGQLKDFHPLFMNKELALSDKNVNYIVHGVDEYLPYDTKFNTFPYIKSLNKSMEEWSRFVKDNNIRQKITDYKTAEAAINSKYDRELENIIQNVQDLFETDVELASAVYSALGFKTLENNKLEQDILEIIKGRENTPSSIFLSFLLNNNLIPKIQEYITSTHSHRHGEWNDLYKRLTLDYSIRNTSSEKTKLISHELMHSLSHKYIVSYEALNQPDFKKHIEKVNENEKIKGTNRRIELANLTAEQITAFDNLVRIKQKVFDFIKAGKFKKNEKFKNTDFGHLTYAFSELDKREDIHEFISEAFSNPILIDVLKQIPTEGNKSNLFKDFINALKTILGFNNDSIIEDILHYSEEAFIKDAIKNSTQQKTAAQKIYTQYLEQNPNGSVEEFKAWVDEFNNDKYFQLASNLVNPAIEELDSFLLDFLKGFNVKSKQFEELKSRLGVNALGATDILNKLIWYVKNRNEETLPEESAHMIVALMGENHQDIKELLDNITNWSEYKDIRDTYLPIYKDENKVKIEAVGKLIAKSLVKNYKANGLDKTKLQKALNNILKFIKNILDSLDISNIFMYNESIADHIAINVLSGNKDYIYKIKNINSNLNAIKEINNNPNAKRIITKFSSINVKMTGSLAIAGTENIRRPEGQGIHDIDFKVKSFDIYNKEVLPKIPTNAVPAHYGWHKKAYSTFAYLIPIEGYRIEVLERKDGFSNGWITSYKLYNEKNQEVQITQANVMSVDFFVYKEGYYQKDFDFSSDFIPASLVYEGKMSLGGKSNPYFFSRDKDQEDYVLRNPKSFIPFEKHIYYQLNDDLSEFISDKSKNTNTNLADVDKLFKDNPELADKVYEALGLNSINESEISYTDNDGNPCASKGGRNSKFQKGGSWEIIKEFKGKSHSQGGIDIEIGNGIIKMSNKQGDFEAKFGLVISNNN